MALIQGNFSFDYYNVSSNTATPSPSMHKYGSTTDNFATVTASGYFDDLLGTTVFTTLQPVPLRVGDVIVINATDAVELVKITGLYPVTVTAITGLASSLLLTQNHVFVGNASNQAADVAMSGDVGIVSSGATTIQAGAVTTAKIADANVTLAKLSAGATYVSRAVIASASTFGGGSATFAASVPGVVGTDIIAPNILAQSNPVSLLTVVPSANTITFTFSGDPGAATLVSYVVFRVAS